MEPTMIEKRQMMLLGFSFFGDPFKISGGWTEENEIGRLWKRFMASQMKPALYNTVQVDINAGQYLFRAVGSWTGESLMRAAQCQTDGLPPDSFSAWMRRGCRARSPRA